MNLPTWLAVPPETSRAVWAWFLVVFVLYMVVRKVVARLRGGTAPTNMARLSDAATFAGSLLLLVGVVNPPTLNAVGNTTGFLIVAGVGGLLYAGEQLWGEGDD